MLERGAVGVDVTRRGVEVLGVTALQEAIKESKRRDDQALAHPTDRIELLQSSLDRAQEEATLDPLTRIPNRRAFDRPWPA